MSTEPIVVELSNSTNFDATTLITLTRDDLSVAGQRYYRGTITTGGVINSDLFGLFAPYSVKLVGISGSFFNPGNTLKVVTPYASGLIRHEVDITPELQYVLVHPGDRLVLRTLDTFGAALVSLVANELTEANHLEYAHNLARPAQRQRLRIHHAGGEPFVGNGGTWTPTFVWDATKGVLFSTDVASGSIPSEALSLRDSKEPIYVRVRFSGIDAGSGEVVVADSATQDNKVIQSGLDSVEWSQVFELAYSDLLGFNAEAPDAGGRPTVDIDVVHVQPGEHLGALVNAASPLGKSLVDAEAPAEARALLQDNVGYVPLRVSTLVGTGVSRVISPYAGTLTRVRTITEGVLTVGDATLTSKINGSAVTGGVITITQAGSAAGDKDSCSPTAANVVAVGDELSLTCGGTNATVTVANCWFDIDRT